MNLPQDFLTRMDAMLGEEYPAFLHSYEEPRRYGLRVNTLKISAEEFRRIAPFHLTPIPWTDNGFFYEKEDAPSRHPFYYAGLYYLQEPSAMTPAQMLPVEPGERVLDLCAAPGGKATALAAKLKGKGLLVANDISASRAKALLKNLEVFGVTNSFVTCTTPAVLAGRFPEFFDKILVDAPCSGEGMFRKDIANANAWSLEKVKNCAKTQKDIVDYAVFMLRPGGMLLYSTCTFAPEEDEQVIAYLLEKYPEMGLVQVPMADGFCEGRPELAEGDWKSPAWKNAPDPDRKNLKNCVRLFPHKIPGEGHFLALLRKRGGEAFPAARTEVTDIADMKLEKHGRTGKITESAKEARAAVYAEAVEYTKLTGNTKNAKASKTAKAVKTENTGKAANADMDSLRSFCQQISLFQDDTAELLQHCEVHNGQVYYVPEVLGLAAADGSFGRGPGRKGDRFQFLRKGLYLGEIKKDRFEPSQAFAMSLRAKDCAAVLDFDHADERVLRYLRGETIEVNDTAAAACRQPERTPERETKRDEGDAVRSKREECSASDICTAKMQSTSQKSSWRLVCVNGYPLGWGKLTNDILKNKYHPGWRIHV